MTSKFKRKERDYYPTPYAGVVPLLPFLKSGTRFIEPCAGDGRLVQHLEANEHKCVYASDIEPMDASVERQDALTMAFPKADMIITNPPWDRKLLHPMIERFSEAMPTWLLFDGDWAYNVKSFPMLQYCKQIVAVGRLSWEGNGVQGVNNCAWYLFDRSAKQTVFHGKSERAKKGAGNNYQTHK